MFSEKDFAGLIQRTLLSGVFLSLGLIFTGFAFLVSGSPAGAWLLRAAAQYGLDLARSWMVGDAESDVEAGRRAGCRTILVGGDAPTRADQRASNMADLQTRLAGWLAASPAGGN